MLPLLVLLAACSGDSVYIVEGTVVDVAAPDQVTVQHEEIVGYMSAMTMPFTVRDPAVIDGVKPGDQIYARLVVGDDGHSWLEKVRVTGHGAVPALALGPVPVKPGTVMPRTEVPLATGGTMVVGAGQAKPTLLTFLYTTCPLPEFCPAVVTRLQGLQSELTDEAQIVAVTVDPEGDTLEVLAAFSESVGAKPEIWRFGRLSGEALDDLVMLGGLPITRDTGQILHGIRFLVLDRQGRLVERYDDIRFPADRVLQQLRTGGPPAPAGMSGTLTPG